MPRGIKKENAHIDQWLKEIAPSEELRKWFHQEKDFSEFKKRYQKELKKKEVHEVVEELLKILEKDTVTLIYSAKDEVHNNAVVLQSYLQDARRKK
ncbi:DUF488 domain-containing protein [Jeotgalibaca sp. MA1X17-3]|uniref:DUF488 domain-containing protein n=1 Tax=Jeotgalibaca sp. MA1X17-3 TaxID=2908211 RepID=UPI0037BE3229